MEIKEINELTRNWTVDEFADFLHYLLQHGDRESIRSWWCSTSLLRKLEAAGLAELDGREVALTPSGSKLRDALYLLEESDGLADARLNLRIHRLEDPHAAPLGADALMLLVAGRSGRVRVDAARMLMEDVDGGREYADRLAKCWDPKVRILAAPYADPHLFLDETDHDVIEAVIKGGRADDVCRERWISPDEPFKIRLAAGALVTDGGRADRMLDAMEPDERVSVQDVRYPKEITSAYAAAQSAEVQKRKASNEQETAKVEAETKRIKAQGEADANDILNSSLSENVLRQKYIDALSNAKNLTVVPDGSVPMVQTK